MEIKSETLLANYLDNVSKLKLLQDELNHIADDSEIEGLTLAGRDFETIRANTNIFHSRTEKYAIQRIFHFPEQKQELLHRQNEIRNQLHQTHTLLERLTSRERFLVEQRYFCSKPDNTWENISKSYSEKFRIDYQLHWRSIKWHVKSKILVKLDSILDVMKTDVK